MTEQTNWLQTYGWAVAAAVILIAAALLIVIGKRHMANRQATTGKPYGTGKALLVLDCIEQENKMLEKHRGELLTSLRTAAQRERLRSVDLRISACWFAGDGIQGAADAMLDAISASLEAGGSAAEIRESVINPYVLPVRMRLQGLRRAMDEIRADCYPIPDDADLRLFLELAPIYPIDTTQAALQKAADNRRLIEQCLMTHGYDVHYDQLLDALLMVFDGPESHAFDEGEASDAVACTEALERFAEDVKQLRIKYARP